jgi:hypothetical protein
MNFYWSKRSSFKKNPQAVSSLAPLFSPSVLGASHTPHSGTICGPFKIVFYFHIGSTSSSVLSKAADRLGTWGKALLLHKPQLGLPAKLE